MSTELQSFEEDDGSEADEIILRELAEQEKRCIGSLLEVWIRIGDVLSGRKKKCPHGTWRPWLRTHSSYSDDAAERYIKIFRGKDRLRNLANTAPVRFLSDALLLVQENDSETRAALIEESQSRGKSVRAVVQARRKATSPVELDSPEPPGERDPELRARVIDALCGKGIPKLKASKLMDSAKGDTEAEIIESALRRHGQAKPPGQISEPVGLGPQTPPKTVAGKVVEPEKSTAVLVEEFQRYVSGARQGVSSEKRWKREVLPKYIAVLQRSREPDFDGADSAKIREKMFKSLQLVGYPQPDEKLIDRASFFLNDLGINPLTHQPKTLSGWLRNFESALTIPTRLERS